MHESVLVEEVLDVLAPRSGGVYVDGTLGSGGHAAAILRKAGAGAMLLGIDRDAEALERSAGRLAGFGAQVKLVRGAFADMAEMVHGAGFERVDGVLLDIGVSSEQLDTARRGFSFGADGPLDMRMDQGDGSSAADLVNGLSEKELSDMFFQYGEERKSRQLARAIVAVRGQAPVTTTLQLAELVSGVVGGRKGRLHPATRVFQALRIKVNDELGQLERGLEQALGLLKEGGRLAVVSFHRLEDRLAKNFARRHEGIWEALPAGGVAWRGQLPPVRILTRKPVAPGSAEISRNPRSRSARLRGVERREGPFDRKGSRREEGRQ